jgi:hypothetical protein
MRSASTRASASVDMLGSLVRPAGDSAGAALAERRAASAIPEPSGSQRPGVSERPGPRGDQAFQYASSQLSLQNVGRPSQ